jgi:hypothetical protein
MRGPDMATRYHIYMGDDNDGPVNYADPVGDSADPWLDVGAEPVGVSGALVRWVFLPDPARPAPDGFNVYATPGPSVDYAAGPVLVILHVAGARDYRATLAGLTGGVSYSIGVRATIGAAEERNEARATVIPRGTPPLPVSDLTATASRKSRRRTNLRSSAGGSTTARYPRPARRS